MNIADCEPQQAAAESSSFNGVFTTLLKVASRAKLIPFRGASPPHSHPAFAILGELTRSKPKVLLRINSLMRLRW